MGSSCTVGHGACLIVAMLFMPCPCKMIFSARVSSNAKKGSIPVWSDPLQSDLPDLSQFMDSSYSRKSWKKFVKYLLKTN